MRAQVKVTADKDVGIGTNNTAGARMMIDNTTKAVGLKLENNNVSTTNNDKYGIFSKVFHATTSDKAAYGMYNEITHQGSGSGYGIYNHLPLTGAGTGQKTGLFNKIYQVSGATQRILGVYNELWPYSAGEATGVFNFVREYGTGEKTGIKNFLYQGPGATGATRGIYSLVQPQGTGTSYGLYNQVNTSGVVQGDGPKIGVYNYVRQKSTSSNYAYGQQTFLRPDGTGDAFGFYNRVENEGTGNRKGISNWTYQSSSNTSQIMGVENRTYSYGTSNGFGIYNTVDTDSGTSGSRYGIYNSLDSAGTGIRYALYSEVTGGGNYAGYFKGNVHVIGTLTQTSDERLKDDIQDIEGGLSIINALRPRSYTMRPEADQPGRGRRSYGFIAQELEEIIPNIVEDVVTPGRRTDRVRTEQRERILVDRDDDGNPVERTEVYEEEVPFEEFGPDQVFKAVSYEKLIPFLVQAMKEQQAQIEALQRRIEILERQ